MNHATAITEDSFRISGRGLILELNHLEEGLPKGTVLISDKTGLRWKVIARVLFDHAVQEQRIFESESVEYMLMRFETSVKRMKSIEGIKDREKQDIYQYFMKPIGHDSKPPQGEELLIDYSQPD